MNTRNQPLVFARRTRKNLEFIEQAAVAGADVHPVTQLALSLLGMIVFPKEKLDLDPIAEVPLASLVEEGWPSWNITRQDRQDPTDTLGDLIKHLRNAVAHGRVTFSSDSPHMEEVTLLVEDKRLKDTKPTWGAEIWAPDLREFCQRLLGYLVEKIH